MSDNKELAVPTITIKQKQTTTTETDLVFNLPAYINFADLIYYKIIDEKLMIAVTCFSTCKLAEIQIKDNANSAFYSEHKDSTEEEFNAKYAEAMKRITEQSGVNI